MTDGLTRSMLDLMLDQYGWDHFGDERLLDYCMEIYNEDDVDALDNLLLDLEMCFVYRGVHSSLKTISI